jgi:xanthine dehydrogenase YagR molybdenum-binding subunit
MSTIGRPVDRVDGSLKVTGAATYAADYRLPNMLYGVPVGSTIAAGELLSLDIAAARATPGVVEIFHHDNFEKLREAPSTGMPDGPDPIVDERRPPLSDTTIRYYGQYIALVVAETFEAASEGAMLVRATYRPTDPATPLGGEPTGPAREENARGDVDSAFAAAPVRIDAVYETPVETHNPIELHATVAAWAAGRVTLYETTQAVVNHRRVLSIMLGVPASHVRVVSHFLGSGFGGKLWPWPQSPLAAAAARTLQRPVKVVVTRPMMFQNVGHRPYTHQRIRIAAERDGTIVALDHDSYNTTSILDDYEESCGEGTPSFYGAPNLRVRSALRRRHTGTPTAMRGPGAVPGLFATESATNELADALQIDPVQLRIQNEPEHDLSLKVPFSSRHYVECLTLGAQRFGWHNRSAAIGSMRADNQTILGWGMAGASWIAERFAADVSIELRDDDSAEIRCATQDIGTGTYTMLAQIAAHELAIPLERVHVTLGDTDLPPGPISGGSMVTASIIPAIERAARSAREQLARNGGSKAIGHGSSPSTFGEEHPTVSRHSYGAHFVEIGWQPHLGRLRVRRIVTVMDAGRIINPKTARNQIAGAMVMGVGMALLEETIYDPRTLEPLNRNLADYMVATNADVPAMDITFLDYPDMHVNELGARGVGEIGLAGVAAAIAAAAHHATGVRVRALPITIEKLLL